MTRIVLAIGAWTLVFLAVCHFFSYVMLKIKRNQCRNQMTRSNRVVHWNRIEKTPYAGVVWLNRSTKYFGGMRLWWIPVRLDEEEDLFVAWHDRGLLIEPQNLKSSTITASGHRIEDYDER